MQRNVKALLVSLLMAMLALGFLWRSVRDSESTQIASATPSFRVSERSMVEGDMVRSMVTGGRTVVEEYGSTTDAAPQVTHAAATRPLTNEEVEIVERNLRRHMDEVMRAILPLADSTRTEDFVQVAAGRSSMAESSAALSCLRRGQAFILLEGSRLRESKSWTYLQQRIESGPNAYYATIAVDLANWPDVVAYRQEFSNVQRFKNDEVCFEWNALAFEVRREIVEEGLAARLRLREIQAMVQSADRGSVEGLRLWEEWARLSTIESRMPRGAMGEFYEAIPGQTVFNTRDFTARAGK